MCDAQNIPYSKQLKKMSGKGENGYKHDLHFRGIDCEGAMDPHGELCCAENLSMKRSEGGSYGEQIL